MRTSIRLVATLLSAATFGAAGCAATDDDDDDVFADASAFRCGESVGVGLIGLDSIDIAGTPKITGKFANAFSNGQIRLSGNFSLAGDAISAETVRIDGNRKPGGEVVEGAPTMARVDPSAEIAAAKAKNDNAKVPCVRQGNKCNSPIVGGALDIGGKDGVTLEAGTYYFTKIKSCGQATLNVKGTVKVYLESGASLSGGSAANPTNDSLTIVSNTTDDISISGGGTAVMHVIAPRSMVRLTGNSAFKGSLLGKHLKISGTADLVIDKDIARTDYSECTPDPVPEEDASSEGCGADDGTDVPDHPTEPPPDQLP